MTTGRKQLIKKLIDVGMNFEMIQNISDELDSFVNSVSSVPDFYELSEEEFSEVIGSVVTKGKDAVSDILDAGFLCIVDDLIEIYLEGDNKNEDQKTKTEA